MADALEFAFNYVFANEGGYTNNPNDSGGPTKFGITIKTLCEWHGCQQSSKDVQALDIETAKKIYEKNYWTPLGCHEIQSVGVATCLFDTGILYGITAARALADRVAVICKSPVKSMLSSDERLIASINAIDPGEFITTYRMLVLSRIDWIIHNNQRDVVFRRGWSNRADRLLTLRPIVPVIN